VGLFFVSVLFVCVLGGGEGYVDGVAWVGVLEDAVDGDGCRVAAAAACDGHLGAFDVELRDAGRPGVVDAELLDAEQVVARGDAGGDGGGVAACDTRDRGLVVGGGG
jgi:hypothetical protein